MTFHFQLTRPGIAPEPLGSPVEDNGEALACAQRMALDLADKRKHLLGEGCAVIILDDDGNEIHREGIDSAVKHA